MKKTVDVQVGSVKVPFEVDLTIDDIKNYILEMDDERERHGLIDVVDPKFMMRDKWAEEAHDHECLECEYKSMAEAPCNCDPTPFDKRSLGDERKEELLTKLYDLCSDTGLEKIVEIVEKSGIESLLKQEHNFPIDKKENISNTIAGVSKALAIGIEFLNNAQTELNDE